MPNLQPFVYAASDGLLALGAAVAFTSGQDATFLTLRADVADVIGTIRFPNDRWTPVGAGLVIMGGGLQFDETGAFLMRGTLFQRR